MYDLIYGPYQLFEEIKKEYPNVTFKDASDFIHEERFEIDGIDGEDISDTYIKFAITHGFASNSFSIQLLLFDKEGLARAKAIIEESKL